MTTRDLKSGVDAVQSLLPQQFTTSAVNGSGVDLRGLESAQVLFNVGAAGGTVTTAYNFTMEESDDDSTYTTVAAADMDGTPPSGITQSTGGSAMTRVGYKGSKRYIRGVISAGAGTAPTLQAAATVLRGRGAQTPLA